VCRGPHADQKGRPPQRERKERERAACLNHEVQKPQPARATPGCCKALPNTPTPQRGLRKVWLCPAGQAAPSAPPSRSKPELRGRWEGAATSASHKTPEGTLVRWCRWRCTEQRECAHADRCWALRGQPREAASTAAVRVRPLQSSLRLVAHTEVPENAAQRR
jgi:hypothetical protein